MKNASVWSPLHHSHLSSPDLYLVVKELQWYEGSITNKHFVKVRLQANTDVKKSSMKYNSHENYILVYNLLATWSEAR